MLHGTTESSLNPVEIIQNLTTNCQRFVKVSMSNEKFTLKFNFFKFASKRIYYIVFKKFEHKNEHIARSHKAGKEIMRHLRPCHHRPCRACC